MRKPSKMLPLQMIILVSMVVSPSLGTVTDDKCKCLMCVCDVDPHPLPPELPSHHHPPPPEPEYYPPPQEPEYYPPPSEPQPTPECYPPPSEPEPTPEYYVPPPAEPYEYPWGAAYGPPAPVLGIVGTPGQMYPRDSSFNPSGANRRRCHGLSSLVLAFSLISGVLSLLMSTT